MKLKRLKNRMENAQGTKKFKIRKISHFIVILKDNKIVSAFFIQQLDLR